jgi:hypothetical protein
VEAHRQPRLKNADRHLRVGRIHHGGAGRHPVYAVNRPASSIERGTLPPLGRKAYFRHTNVPCRLRLGAYQHPEVVPVIGVRTRNGDIPLAEYFPTFRDSE